MKAVLQFMERIVIWSASSAAWVTEQTEQRGLMDAVIRFYVIYRLGGNLELGCNPPRRKTVRNQTKGR